MFYTSKVLEKMCIAAYQLFPCVYVTFWVCVYSQEQISSYAHTHTHTGHVDVHPNLPSAQITDKINSGSVYFSWPTSWETLCVHVYLSLWGQFWVLRWFEDSGLVLGSRFRVWGLRIYYVNNCPHKNGTINVCGYESALISLMNLVDL